jgi:hypothetical protein
MQRTKGWLIQNVYPYLLDKGTEHKYKEDINLFINSCTSSVQKQLGREALRFRNRPISPERDPVPVDFLNTPHPDIHMAKPRGKGAPYFYVCPSCRGRLFRGQPSCLFCGKFPARNIELNKKQLTPYLNFLDYLFPRSSKPEITPVLAALKNPDLAEDYVTETEIRILLKEIDKYIPE